MKRLTDEQCEMIYREAMVAARIATEKMIEENPGFWYPCGFSWITIHPANCRFANYLKSKGVGQKAYGSGLQIWNPSNNVTQWMDAKVAGSQAFKDVLTKYDIVCKVHMRED